MEHTKPAEEADPISKSPNLPQPSSQRDLEDGICDSSKAPKLPRPSNFLGSDNPQTPDHPKDDSNEETTVQPKVATDAATVSQPLPKHKLVQWHIRGLPESIIFRNHLASPEFLQTLREQRKRSVAAGFTEFEDEEDEDEDRIRITPKHRPSESKDVRNSAGGSSSK